MPKQSVECQDEDRHDGDTKYHARHVTAFRRFRDVSTKAMSDKLRIAPGHDFRHDGGVPTATGGGYGPGYIIREYPRDDHLAPPQKAVDPKIAGGLSQISWKRRGTSHDI